MYTVLRGSRYSLPTYYLPTTCSIVYITTATNLWEHALCVSEIMHCMREHALCMCEIMHCVWVRSCTVYENIHCVWVRTTATNRCAACSTPPSLLYTRYPLLLQLVVTTPPTVVAAAACIIAACGIFCLHQEYHYCSTSNELVLS